MESPSTASRVITRRAKQRRSSCGEAACAESVIEPELDQPTRAAGDRAHVVVLLATSPAAQEGAGGFSVGTRWIADPRPLVVRQLADGESLEVVHGRRRPPGLSALVCPAGRLVRS